MGLVRLQNVTKQFAERVVLDDVTLEISTSERIGLVGPNGAGKTTLFKLLAGLLSPDFGSVTLSRGLEVGYLPQEPQVGAERTLHDEVLSVFADVLALEERLHALSDQMSVTPPGPGLHELMQQYDKATARFDAAGGYRFEQRLDEILTGLGFSPTDYKLPMHALSGGQKCRAALAKLLLKDSDFLLLDEPTNHLDIDAVRWLEKFLANHAGGAIIISHDRYLLDRVASRILELDNARVRSYPGNYTAFVETRDLRRLTQVRECEKDREFIEKERAFIARHMGSQRTAEAKGRLTRLERRIAAGEFVLEKPQERDPLRLRFDGAADEFAEGTTVVETAGLTKRYGDKTLFADLSLRVAAEHRLGITGPNGTGKSTLLKILMDQIEPDQGEHRFGAKARVGYFAQESSELDPLRNIVQEIQSVRPDLLESQVRNLAARFLFRGDDVFKRVGALSGGEQSRVRLLRMILQMPNVLVLDEPTNHLDIPSREVLEEALRDFPGAIIAVSHDRYFLDRICNRLLVMRDGSARLFTGNYSYYIEQAERERALAEAVDAERRAEAEPRSRKPAPPSSPKATARTARPRSRFARLTLEALEAWIVDAETKLAVLQERFGDARVYQDAAALAKLQAEFDTLKAELTEAEEDWYRRGETG
ncbi:MAG: ribosomal protection-like ABC-F family protein [Phycisphaerae bacterium]